jgi:hypothetical protein
MIAEDLKHSATASVRQCTEYGNHGQFGLTPASFAARFGVPVRVRLTRLAGFDDPLVPAAADG